MSRHFRLVAALLSLLSFSASFAESVWASTCAPMEAQAVSTAGVGEPTAMTMPGMDMSESTTPSEDSRLPQEPDCPLGAVATFGCHTISIPSATGATALTPLPIDVAPVVAVDRVPHLLLAVSLFRPPRA